jgi:hypothetical protein
MPRLDQPARHREAHLPEADESDIHDDVLLIFRHCEEPTGPAFGRPDDELSDEAIQSFFLFWIASLRSQ